MGLQPQSASPGSGPVNLLNVDWSSVICSDNVIKASANSKSIFMSAVDNVAPVKEAHIKQRTEPWVSKTILQSIKDRDKSYQLYKKDKLIKVIQTLKSFEINTGSDLQCKKSYFKEKIESENHLSKSLRRSLKELCE